MSEDGDVPFVLEEPWSDGISVHFRIDRVLAFHRSPHQEVLVAETEAYGRALFIDGLIQSTECDEALYHEPFIHCGMIVHGDPRNVLLAGIGEGAALREIVRHRTVESITAVDLDREVVDVCRRCLPDWSAGAFDDPRLKLRFEDVQITLATSPDGAFDVIVLDITDPVESGPAVDLFTVRFFRQVARCLAPDGLLILQAGELDPVDMSAASVVRATLAEAFPWVHFGQMFLPSFHALWGVALAGERPFALDPPDLEARIAALSASELKVYSPTVHRATLELAPYLRARLERPARPVTGDGEDRHVVFSRGSSEPAMARRAERS